MSYRPSVVLHVTSLRCLSSALCILQVGVMTSGSAAADCVCVCQCLYERHRITLRLCVLLLVLCLNVCVCVGYSFSDHTWIHEVLPSQCTFAECVQYFHACVYVIFSVTQVSRSGSVSQTQSAQSLYQDQSFHN